MAARLLCMMMHVTVLVAVMVWGVVVESWHNTNVHTMHDEIGWGACPPPTFRLPTTTPTEHGTSPLDLGATTQAAPHGAVIAVANLYLSIA